MSEDCHGLGVPCVPTIQPLAFGVPFAFPARLDTPSAAVMIYQPSDPYGRSRYNTAPKFAHL